MIQISFPFNYGENSPYTKEVENRVYKIANMKVITDFVEYSEYEKIFAQSAAFVFNAHRQMAMGNIFIAIRNNTKVYLNRMNSSFEWFKSEGFDVFSIEDLRKDLETGNVFLTPEESAKNLTALRNITKKYTNEAYIRDVLNLIN